LTSVKIRIVYCRKARKEIDMATIIVSEWAVSGVDPLGSRHLTNHASFVGIVASGTTSSGTLSLGSVAVTDGDDISATKCFTVRFVDFADGAETVDSCTWYVNNTDISATSSQIVYEVADTWTQNFALLQDAELAAPTTSGLAETVLRTGGKNTFFADSDVHSSQYHYVAMQTRGDTPVGLYGSTGGLDLKFTFAQNSASGSRD
jgi:hypothetical protein